MAMYDSSYTGEQIDYVVANANTMRRITVRLEANGEYTFPERMDFFFVSWNIGGGRNAYVVSSTIEKIPLPVAELTSATFSLDGTHVVLKSTYSGTANFYIYAMIRS